MVTRTLAQAARGFAMGAADIVPGVSGGTVALVLGIYRTLVAQVRAASRSGLRLLRGDFGGFWSSFKALDWAFLLPLVAGIGVAVVTLASLLHTLLEEQPENTSGAFFGLVAASIVVAYPLLRRPDGVRAAVMVLSALATFALLGFRGGDVSDPALYVYVGAGAVAICAMILPGISGSFILLMLGMYDHVIEAVDERDLVVIACVGLGAVIGLASFSSLLDNLLERHHDTVLAALIGLMAGSLRVLWPWPEGADSAALHAPPADDWTGPVLWAVIGAVLVLGVVGLSERLGRRAPVK